MRINTVISIHMTIKFFFQVICVLIIALKYAFIIFFFQLPTGSPFILPVIWYTGGRGGPSSCMPYNAIVNT